MSGRAPLISILLPTHNRADVIGFAIESVLGQTFADFELLVVGDGCTDDTAAVVGRYRDPRITWLDLSKAPGFGYANRNIALRRAQGEYVAYIPHDDLWLADHLETLVRCQQEQGAEFVCSRVVLVDRAGGMWPSDFNLNVAVAGDEIVPTELEIGIAPVLHRRDSLDKYGYWDESGIIGGDHRLWVRFIEGAGRRGLAFHPEPTTLHFIAVWREQSRRRWQLHERQLRHRLGIFSEMAPPMLRIAVPDGMTEQEVVWRQMSADPVGWAREFRAAVTALRDARLMRLNDTLPLALAAVGTRVRRGFAGYFRRLSRRERERFLREREDDSPGP